MKTGIGSHQSAAMKNDEWLTPPEVLAALGRFDLYPCSPLDEARPWPTADRHFSKADNGLSREWAGRVWLNPPYGREASQWLARLADHGNGVALIFARTETDMFFRHVWDKADAILFLRGRPHFYCVTGEKAKANSGAPSCLIAYGAENMERLRDCGLEGRLVVLGREQAA